MPHDDTVDSMIGRTIGPYTIVEQIGHGAMGVVYRGIHQELKEQRAIKLLSPAAFASQAARQHLRWDVHRRRNWSERSDMERYRRHRRHFLLLQSRRLQRDLQLG